MILFIIWALACAAISIFGKNMLFGAIAGFIISVYFAVRIGQSLFSGKFPQILSANKDFLGIFDKPISLFGKDDSFVLISWKDILDIKTEIIGGRKGSATYIVLQCTDSAIQNVINHRKKISGGGILRVYEIKDNLIILNATSLLDISLTDLLTLLKEIHKEAICAR